MKAQQAKGNTEKSFSDKWHQNPSLIFDDTLNESSEVHRWILERNGFKNDVALSAFLADKKRILDAGCGNGRITALLRKLSNPELTSIVGIDLVAADVASKNLQKERNVSFFMKDLLSNLSDLGRFDFIYCQEVLHHTADPLKAFRNLVGLLEVGGEIAIYVYKKKAPLREFSDDFIRQKIAGLNYSDALNACEQITALGKVLHDSRIKINVPAVDALEIEAGEYDLQRFVYHFFMKCFWNDDFSFHENAVINYDWYHPQLCSRHTLEEVLGWFMQENLEVTHQLVDFYGITIRGRKQA